MYFKVSIDDSMVTDVSDERRMMQDEPIEQGLKRCLVPLRNHLHRFSDGRKAVISEDNTCKESMRSERAFTLSIKENAVLSSATMCASDS